MRAPRDTKATKATHTSSTPSRTFPRANRAGGAGDVPGGVAPRRPERPTAGFVRRSERDVASVDAALAARDALALAHTSLVKRVALRIGRRLPPHVDRSDLVSVGTIGLLEAAARYRPSTGVPFEAFARRRVHGAIMDALRELDWVPRSVRSLERKAEAAATILRQQLGRDPSQDEIANHVGVRPESSALGSALSETTPGEPLQEAMGMLEQCPDRSEGVEASVLRSELAAHVHREVSRLPRREQRILDGYYHDDLTMGEIGAQIGVCESRVSQLRSAALAQLRPLLAPAVGLAPASGAPSPRTPLCLVPRATPRAHQHQHATHIGPMETGACQAA